MRLYTKDRESGRERRGARGKESIVNTSHTWKTQPSNKSGRSSTSTFCHIRATYRFKLIYERNRHVCTYIVHVVNVPSERVWSCCRWALIHLHRFGMKCMNKYVYGILACRQCKPLLSLPPLLWLPLQLYHSDTCEHCALIVINPFELNDSKCQRGKCWSYPHGKGRI